MIDIYTCRKVSKYLLGIENFSETGSNIFDLIFGIIGFFLWIYAIILAWGCNQGGQKFLMVIVAILIPYIYLIGYFIYHKVLGHGCDS
jgi:hypothetical protein